MSVVLSFAAAQQAKDFNSLGQRKKDRVNEIRRLAAIANLLELKLENAFGLKPQIRVKDSKEYQEYFASYPDSLKVYSRTSDYEFGISVNGDTRDEAIAALYYRLTTDLQPGYTIRKGVDAQFETFFYDPHRDEFMRVTSKCVVAYQSPALRAQA